MNKFDEVERCKKFLEINGWEQCSEGDSDYFHFCKNDSVSIDLDEDEMVFIGEFGDFLHLQTSYYSLIGALLELRQISVTYIGVHKERKNG